MPRMPWARAGGLLLLLTHLLRTVDLDPSRGVRYRFYFSILCLFVTSVALFLELLFDVLLSNCIILHYFLFL